MNNSGYKDLDVWKKSIELVKEVYRISKLLPKFEQYILVAQMLRSAISIPSNIAEGYARMSKPEFARFLGISLASGSELETQLLVCMGEYAQVDYKKANDLIGEIQRMLYRLKQKTKE